MFIIIFSNALGVDDVV